MSTTELLDEIAKEGERVGEKALQLVSALRPWAAQPDDVREACVQLTVMLARFSTVLDSAHAEVDA